MGRCQLLSGMFHLRLSEMQLLTILQEERRSRCPKYYFPLANEKADGPVPNVSSEEMRGKKRARAEDFL